MTAVTQDLIASSPARVSEIADHVTGVSSKMTGMSTRDWGEWHAAYDDPSSSLSQRLAIVQRHLVAALDRCPAGDVTLVSACAGRGLDVIGALRGHPRANDVRARLVELDPGLADVARGLAAAADLPQVEVITGDAALTDVYAGYTPAEVVVFCGIFGNITDDDIRDTVAYLPRLCAPGATVLWTRHRNAPDLTPTIRGWFEDAGFEELAFEVPVASLWIAVGVNRLVGPPLPFEPGRKLFAFVR
jgi:hypothetical protein